MEKRKEYILVLGIALMGWGFLFPQYTFTSNSYRIVYEEYDMRVTESMDDMSVAMQTAHSSDDVPVEHSDEEIRNLSVAVSEGRVRYKFKFVEYLKEIFS